MGLRGKAAKPKGAILKFEATLGPPPSYMDAAGKREYQNVKNQLESSGVELYQPDTAILAIYAQAVADIGRLTREIRKEGEVIEGRQAGMVRNPKCSILEAARKTVIASGAKLGFSPVDRQRVPASTRKGSTGNEFSDI